MSFISGMHKDVSPRVLRVEGLTSMENGFPSLQARGQLKYLRCLQVACQTYTFGDLKVLNCSLKMTLAASITEKKRSRRSITVWQVLEPRAQGPPTMWPFSPWDPLCLPKSSQTLPILQAREPWGHCGAQQ